MRHERTTGITYSSVLHALLVFLAIFGLPHLFSPEKFEEPAAITVEILPIGPMTNVRNAPEPPAKEDKQDTRPDPKLMEKPEPAPKEKPKPSPPVKTPDEKKPEPPPPEEKKDKPDEKKPEEKKPDEKKNKTKEEELEAVLKSVQQTAAKDTPTESKDDKSKQQASSKSKSRSNKFDPNSPEAMSLRDAIANQVYKCWNVPAGARDAENLIIIVEVEYDQQGTAMNVKLSDQSRGKYNDPFYRAAADSAMRAVRHPNCNPLKDMPADSYHMWQYVDITFNPKDMLF